jgi:hypothetical protein
VDLWLALASVPRMSAELREGGGSACWSSPRAYLLRSEAISCSVVILMIWMAEAEGVSTMIGSRFRKGKELGPFRLVALQEQGP